MLIPNIGCDDMNKTLTALLALIIVGCSTTPTGPEDEKPIPPEHIYSASYLVNKPGNESVKFTRDKGMLGAGCPHMIFIDGDQVFEIFSSQFVVVSLPPGLHLFRLDTGQGACPNESYSQETTLVLGQPQTYRISISSNFNLMLTRIQ